MSTNGASSIYATPSRGDRTAFPHPPNPTPSPVHHHPSTTSNSSSSLASSSSTLPTSASTSSSVNKDRPMTVAGLLKANANATDPTAASLEQAVNDRNVLCAQNAQLWKLIEKQRSGYNQILKELERVRGERDALKAKLSGGSGRRGSDTERPAKRSFSENPTINLSSDTSHSDSGRETSRRVSDEQHTPTPRSQHYHHLHSSRSLEPLAHRERDPYAQANASYSGSSPSLVVPRSQLPPPPASAPSTVNTDATIRSHKPSPAPLVVPLRSESYNSSNGQRSTTPERPPRKSSLTESMNSGMSASTGNSSMSSPYTPSSQQPQTAPAGLGHTYEQQTPRTTHVTPKSQGYPQIITTPSAPQNTSQVSLNSTNSNGLLSSLQESQSSMLSRDSRISLPDEARQYIANMSDSPVPSPRGDVFTAKPSRAVAPPITIPEHPSGLAPPRSLSGRSGSDSEFLDMNEDEEDESEASSVVTGPEADDTEYDNEGLDGGSVRDPRHGGEAVPQVDDFPLPPATAHFQAQHQQGMPRSQKNMYAQAYAQADSTSAPQSSTEQLGQQQLTMRSEQSQHVAANFRALPLLSTDLPHTTVTVSHSFVRPNDRGKEVLSFLVHVDPGHGKEGWRVEKMYSDVLGLDQRVRSSVGKGVGKKIASLPEGKLWKDHAPAKVDQRKAVLESYLQMLINLPVKHNDEVIAFFTSDIVREAKQPVMQAGHKEGYLTKRGKNFGGWKTRYFVLQGPVLEYYDCRGGAHLGSIAITGAQIGRQQRTERAPGVDDEKEYRHAFLIVESKKGPGGNHPRHVLCAESDEDRDSWVEMLVRYFTGTYSEEPVVKFGPGPIAVNAASYQNGSQPRSSTSSDSPSSRRPHRGFSKDDISISKGAAVPISQLPQDESNAKLFQSVALVVDDHPRSSSPSKSAAAAAAVDSDRERQGGGGGGAMDAYNARRLAERGQPSSLPDSSPLSSVSQFTTESPGAGQRANSELGHYPDLSGRSNRQVSPERHRTREPHDKPKSFHPTLNAVAPSPTSVSPVDRIPSPDKLDKVKISGPLNGVPIPSGFKFGHKEGKDASGSGPSEAAVAERRAKSRSFWGFGKMHGDKGHPVVPLIPRAVFGVPLEEALDVAQIAHLPAIVFRSIQYLEAKKAEQEEGIYRLSGSSAVIKSLKDRFNMEGDVDLLASDEYWDPHAIAGLLKSFLRELPASILTRDLHLRFLSVIDFVDAQERIQELSQLIAALPIANYSLLRALTAHLILIVQNSSVNKMTMRNVGIVFSPTLGIPAGVFSLMLGEFNRVFNVDEGKNGPSNLAEDGEGMSDVDRRNSRQYTDAAADQLLGLTGRSLKAAPAEEALSEGDELSIQDESGTEATDDPAADTSMTESSGAQPQYSSFVTPPDTPVASKMSRVGNVAANKGLNVSVTGSERGNRHSKLIGLPSSPRPPPHSPRQHDLASS